MPWLLKCESLTAGLYVPVIVCDPPDVVLNVTEQLALLAVNAASVQLELVKVPPPVVVNATVPAGCAFALPESSATVAVQEVVAPCTRDAGVQLTVVLVPGLTLNVIGLDVPPPGAGLKTVTRTSPSTATSSDRIAAVTCVPLTNVVWCATPLK